MIRSTALATSNSNYVGQAKATCLGQQRSCVSILGQTTAGRRYGRRHRPDAALVRLEAPVGGSRNQRTDGCTIGRHLNRPTSRSKKFNSANQGLWTRGLLIRRRIADDDLAFFTTWCPAGTSIETLVAVEGHRWAIEDSFETAKNEIWLDHQRDEILAWLAPSRVPGDARLRHDGRDPASRRPATAKNKTARPGESQSRTTPPLIRWSIQESAASPSDSARNRIQPAHIIAWSFWRRAHQAAAQRAHLKTKRQL